MIRRQKKKRAFPGKVLLVLFCVFVLSGFFIALESPKRAMAFIEQFYKDKKRSVLRAHYTVEEITERLPPKEGMRKAYYSFFPYLLCDLKFINDRKMTEEGVLLWDMTSGEMVIDTNTFTTSIGFRECFEKELSLDEMEVLRMLQKLDIPVKIAPLAKLVHSSEEELQKQLDDLIEKELIFIDEERIRLHMKEAFFPDYPVTHIQEPFVCKQVTEKLCKEPYYSEEQVEKCIQAIFKKGCVIRRKEIAFVPFITVVFDNPDDSFYTLFFNGITGQEKRISS